MITSGLTVDAADGLHNDGWCWPNTRLTLTSQIDATELRLGVWFKPEPGSLGKAVITVSSDRTPTDAKLVEFDKPVEISIPMAWARGEIISVRLTTPHRASKDPAEKRDLAFCLLSVVAV